MDRDLVKIGLDPADHPGETVLECALPLIQDPVFTVSEQFALDLSSETLQAEIMIPHIGSKLYPRLLGVNNGAFIDKSIPDEVFIPGQKGNYSPIQSWKTKNREKAFAAMDKLSPSVNTPIWGDLQRFDRRDEPWFVMAGRDDSRQKGYELACIATDLFLQNNDQARFIFFPIPGDEGLSGIEFIHELADKYPQYVLGFPFLFREGFFAFLQGATFGIMPSYYEPFGMANEYYLNGVGCIGRATGGITQQIVPHRQVSSFSPSVKRRADKWHPQASPPTGLLFRERDDLPNTLQDWRKINAADYKISSQKSNRLKQRRRLITIQSMADELQSCLVDATQIYLTRQDLYYEMLINGIAYITSNFTWEHTARVYNKIIHYKSSLNGD
jgi:glycosyltransferase involved in cell wall biosynthesis